MNEERDSHGISDWREGCRKVEERLAFLEKQAHALGCIHATIMVNFGLDRPRHRDGIVVGHQCTTHEAMVSVLRQYSGKVGRSHALIANIREAIEAIVIPEGIDAGVILKSSESRVTNEPGIGVVYDNEYFSELGQALVELWNMTSPDPPITSCSNLK